MYSILDAIKTKLSAIDGVTTCKIGIETGLSPADYPIIRIVPSKGEPSETISRNNLQVMIYFGVDLAESDQNLEAVYAALYALETSIINAMQEHNSFFAQWLDTITDEDRLDHYKLFMSRFLVTG